MEVIPEFSGVGQGLDYAVHEARVAQIDQSCKSRQAHLLLLLLLVAFNAGGRRMRHGLHHARRFRLKPEKKRHHHVSVLLVYIFH